MDNNIIVNKYILGPEKDDMFFSGSNILALIALIIAIISAFITYKSLFKSKVLDIRFHKFEKMCLNNLVDIFLLTDNIFEKSSNENIKDFRLEITNVLLDIQLFLISIQKTLYPDLEMKKIEEITEKFSDEIFERVEIKVIDYKASYLTTKFEIYNNLYIYASLNEFQMSMNFLKKYKDKFF